MVMFKELQVSALDKIAYQGKSLHPCFSEGGKQIYTICRRSSHCRYV